MVKWFQWFILGKPRFYAAMPWYSHRWTRAAMRGLIPTYNSAFKYIIGPFYSPEECDAFCDDQNKHNRFPS